MMASRKFKAMTHVHLFILALTFVGFASAQTKVTIRFSSVDVDAWENVGHKQICMHKESGSSTIPLTVMLNTVHSTAKANVDYGIMIDRVITFLPSQNQVCTNVTIKDNDIVEYKKVFYIMMTTTDPSVIVQDSRKNLTFTILNDDKVTIGFDARFMKKPENVSNVSVCMTKTGTSAIPLTVTLNTVDGSAKANVDYGIIADRNIKFGDSIGQVCTNVTIKDDDIVEDDQSFYIMMTTTDPSTVILENLRKFLTFVILNDDKAIIGFRKNFIEVVENIISTPICVFMEGRTNTPVIIKPVSGSNLIKSPSSITFAANQSETCFNLAIQDNTILGYDKTALLFLKEEHRFISVDQSKNPMIVFVIDEDQVTIQFDNGTMTIEEDLKGGKIDLHMVMQGVTEIPIHVKLVTNVSGADTAKDGRDFKMTSKHVVFKGGEQRIITPIYILDDAGVEGIEFFTVNFEIATKTRAFKGKKQTEVLVQIKDSSDLASALKAGAKRERLAVIGFKKNFLTVAENISSIPVCVFMEGRTYTPVIIKPVSGSNLIKSPPSITFAANQSETCFNLTIQDNTILGYDKTASLFLRKEHRFISIDQSKKSLIVFVIDEDQVTIQFDNGTMTIEEDLKGGKIDLHMVMQGVTEIPIHVKLVTNVSGADTAKDGRDFKMTSKHVVFKGGEQRIITPIYILDDAGVEGMEFFTVNFEIATKTRAFKGKKQTEVLVQIKDSSDLASALKAGEERERLAIGLSSSFGSIFLIIVAIALVVYLISRRQKRADDGSVESKADADQN